MPALRMFIPITKVDAARRLVYGLATAETEDRAGEICDYATTKPLYEKWSEEIAKSTGGKSLGNLRAMHGPIAAGKVTAITFNDAAKQIEICAKVVDDAEWTKVQEGVYTGFSQGGAYERRWTDGEGLTRYTAAPTEISLVDFPCLPQAQFEMIKADGTSEQRDFGPAPARRPGLPVSSRNWIGYGISRRLTKIKRANPVTGQNCMTSSSGPWRRFAPWRRKNGQTFHRMMLRPRRRSCLGPL